MKTDIDNCLEIFKRGEITGICERQELKGGTWDKPEYLM